MTNTNLDYSDILMRAGRISVEQVTSGVVTAFQSVTDWEFSCEFVPHQYYRGIEVETYVDSEHAVRVMDYAKDQNISIKDAYDQLPPEVFAEGYALACLHSPSQHVSVYLPYSYHACTDLDNLNTRLFDASHCAEHSNGAPVYMTLDENKEYDCLLDYKNGVYIDSHMLDYLLTTSGHELPDLDLDLHGIISATYGDIDAKVFDYIEKNVYDFLTRDTIAHTIDLDMPSYERVLSEIEKEKQRLKERQKWLEQQVTATATE